jgi:hypothetical protein
MRKREIDIRKMRIRVRDKNQAINKKERKKEK